MYKCLFGEDPQPQLWPRKRKNVESCENAAKKTRLNEIQPKKKGIPCVDIYIEAL